MDAEIGPIKRDLKQEGESLTEKKEALHFAGGLAAFLLLVVLLLNLIEPTAVPVSEIQFSQISEAGLIEALVVEPAGWYWQLEKTIRVQGPNGEEFAERIIAIEPDTAAINAWRDSGGLERQEQGRSWFIGPIFLALLIGLGLWHGWTQIRIDLQGQGSPRRRLQELDKELKAGKITEEEFRERAERIWPEL